MSSLMKTEPKQSFSLSPRNLEEAHKFAEIFCKSSLCPKHLQGKPGDVIVTLQMGYELGLEPMQAIKTIGVINGIPFAYGDGKLAIIMRSPFFEDMLENIDEKTPGNIIAHCTVKRKGREAVTRSFSMNDAKTAGLLSKQGPWQQYPKRMLQHRARGLALSDTFPDVLFGLVSEEEARWIISQEKDITPITEKGIKGARQALGIDKPVLVQSPISAPQEVESPIEDNVEPPDTFEPPILATPQQVCDIKNLIEEYGLHNMSDKWLKAASATCFEEMLESEIQACIEMVITKFAGKNKS